jgi:hypothetical protein
MRYNQGKYRFKNDLFDDKTNTTRSLKNYNFTNAQYVRRDLLFLTIFPQLYPFKFHRVNINALQVQLDLTSTVNVFNVDEVKVDEVF